MASNATTSRQQAFLRSLARALVILVAVAIFVQAHGQEPPREQREYAAPPTRFGAIAFTADGSYSTTWLRKSKEEAEDKVRADCVKFKRGDCEVVGFRRELCAAIASFSTKKDLYATYAGGGLTKDDAKNQALERCRSDKRARACRIRTVVCGDGR